LKSKNTSNIIYIIGAGRSGTTLLDITLGNATNIFNAGELNRFTKRNGIPHDARDEEVICFWKKVSDDLLQQKFDEPKAYFSLSKKYEYHSAFLKLFIPYKNKTSFRIYSAYQKHLFEIIEERVSENFDKGIIIDSSKYPMRGFFLSKIFQDNISFIYVKRNPAAVVTSFQKKDIEQPPKSRIAANLYLLIINGLANIVVKMLGKTHKVSLVSYEDILQSPVATLTRIESELNINLNNSKKLIEENEPLKVGLLFDGNRLRLEKEIIFRKHYVEMKPENLIDKVFHPLHKLIWHKQLKVNYNGDK